MGDFNPFSFSSSSSAKGKNNVFNPEFAFSTTPSVYRPQSRKRRMFTQCTRSTKVNNEVKGSLDSTSSSWTFNIPPNTLEEETDGKNSLESSPGNRTKTKIRPSGLTGAIPCHFEGSRYASIPNPSATTRYLSEKPIKTEKHEESEQEPRYPSQQIIKVSRILKGIPQTPHFWSLRGYSEVTRQTLMDSWDRIFIETVDRIQNIQANEFWVGASKLWATLQELQGMGYNVVALRRRLVELTDVMLKMRTHKSEIRDLKSKAEQHMIVKSWLEYEIEKLRAKVETETSGYDAVMAKVAKMEDEVPNFYDIFTKLVVKAI